MTIDANVGGFEPLYGDAELSEGQIPWDIGGPQPAVQQLVAYGAIRGEVLDPGTGPGHHAIHFASQGYSATGIDGSCTFRCGPWWLLAWTSRGFPARPAGGPATDVLWLISKH